MFSVPNQTTCIICVVYNTLQEHSRTSSPIRPRVLDKLKGKILKYILLNKKNLASS